MDKKENQRVRLTKKLLKDSLMKLLLHQTLADITISQLCENAGINRSTFYKYYGSQYELFGEMENDMIGRIKEYIENLDVVDKKKYQSGLCGICTYLETHDEFIKLLLNNNVDPDLPYKILGLSSLQEIFKESVKGTPEKNGYINTFVVFGSYYAFKDWINNENRESPEEFSKILFNLAVKVCN